MKKESPLLANTESTRQGSVVFGLVVPLSIYLLFYYLLTWPNLHHIGSHIIGDGGDTYQNVWNIWWVREAILSGRNPWSCDLIYHPDGCTLVGATLNPINGILSIPLGWFLDLVQSFNVLVVFAFVMTGWATFLLIRTLGASYWPAVFGGAVFTFSSYHMAHGWGHMQLITLQYLPLFLWAWVRLLNKPTVARGVFAGVLLLLVQLSDYYSTLYAVLGGGLLLASRMLTSGWPSPYLGRDSLRSMAAFAVSATVCCLPLTLALLTHDDKWIGAHDDKHFSNDLLGPFVPGPLWALRDLTEWFWRPLGWHRDQTEFHVSIGTLALSLCIYAWVRRFAGHRARLSEWLVIGVVFHLLSLGPVVKINGTEYPSLPNLYLGLQEVFPPLKMGGVPTRFSAMYLLAAAVTATFGLQWLFKSSALRRRLPRIGAIIAVIGLLFLDCAIVDNPTTKRLHSKTIDKLASLPQGAVVGFHVDAPALWWQMQHKKPIGYAYVARIPQRKYGRALRTLEAARLGRCVEALRMEKARYLIRPRNRTWRFDDRDQFVLLARDELFDLFVHKDDPLAKSSRSSVACGGPATIIATVGEQQNDCLPLHIESKQDAGRPFVCMFSASKGEPKELHGVRLPLAVDAALKLSLDARNPVFRGNQGLLDHQGRATVTIDAAYVEKSLQLADLWFCPVILRRLGGTGACRIGKVQRLRPQ